MTATAREPVKPSPHLGATVQETDTEIVISRTFDAPRPLVFSMFTSPEHMPRWWGPRGFTNTLHAMDVRPGGVCRYTMHGPDGRDYENVITYTEVRAPELLAYKHGEPDNGKVEPVCFGSTINFDDLGGKTRVTMRMRFPTTQEKENVKTYGAIEGGRQTLERLAEHLASQSSPATADAPRDFVITRAVKAPPELVWKLWTQKEHLEKWFGPKGFTIPKCSLDLRPGGHFHYLMRSASGHGEMWGKWVFREIDPPHRLTFTSSFSDEHGNITRAPFDETWPREMLSTVTFDTHAGLSGGTVITVRWSALNATAEERRTFEKNMGSMQAGWTGTFESLDAYIARVSTP